MKKLLTLGLCCSVVAVAFAATAGTQRTQWKPVTGKLPFASVKAGISATLTPQAPPAGSRQGGDTIASALAIASLPYSDAGTTAGYVNDYDSVCPYTGSTAPDVVYSFTPAVDTGVNVTLCTGTTGYDTKLYIFQDSPSTVMGCNDDNCTSPVYVDPYVSSLAGVVLPAGHTYYIVVDGYGSGSGAYTLEVTEAPILPAPANDTCVNAAPISGPYPQTVTGTTLGATQDCAGVLNWNAVWYAIDLPYASNDVLVDFCGTATATSNVGVVYYNDCTNCSAYTIADYNAFPTCEDNLVQPTVLWQEVPGPAVIYFPVYLGAAKDFTLNVDVTVPNLTPTLTVPALANTEIAGPWTVTATAVDPENALTGVTLYWSVNGGAYTSVPMTLGDPDTYTGAIPDAPVGSVVSYYVVATDAMWTVTSATTSFSVFNYQWAPQNLVASDNVLGQVNLSWGVPVAPPEPGQLSEGFEAGIPANWTVYNVDGGDPWVQYSGGAHSGTYSASVLYDVPNNDWLVTPQLAAAANPMLSFWAKAGSATWVPELLTVYVSTTDNQIASMVNMVLDLSVTSTSWVQYTADLSAFAGQDIYIGFYCHSNDMLRLYVDDVLVTGLEAAVASLPGTPRQPEISDIDYKIGVELTKAEAAVEFERMLGRLAAERAFQNYTIYRNGVAVGTSTTLSYVDVPPAAFTTYTYAVSALWDSGESALSNTDTGAMLARPTSGGPDAAGYTWANSLAPTDPAVYSWVDITALGDSLAIVGDDATATAMLPFAFPFYGANYDSVHVCSNGWLNFGATSTAYSNTALPTAGVPDGVVAVLWDDLNVPTVTGDVLQYNDVANGRVIFQWNRVHPLSYPSDTLTFQAILYADGNIQIQYQQVAEAQVADATVGIENLAGTVGLQVNFDNNGGAIADGLAIAIRPFVCETATGVDVTVAGGDATVTWNAVNGATSYKVYGAADGYGPFTLLGTVAGTSYTDVAAQAAGRKFYQVVSACE